MINSILDTVNEIAFPLALVALAASAASTMVGLAANKSTDKVLEIVTGHIDKVEGKNGLE